MSRILHLFGVSIALTMCAPSAFTDIKLDANDIDSIAHFRVFPPSIENDEKLPLTVFVNTDTQGYVWFSSDPNLLRYDGYQVKSYDLEHLGSPGTCGITRTTTDVDGTLWASNCGLYRFDSDKDRFTTFTVTDGRTIHDIADNHQGALWLAGESLLYLFDKNSERVAYKVTVDNDIIFSNIAYAPQKDILWLSSNQGVFKFDPRQKKIEKINTPLDDQFQYMRLGNITLDSKNNELWVTTPKGLLNIDTKNLDVKHYLPTDENNSLPIMDVTATMIDSAGNVWVGLEKEGICLYRRDYDDFVCLRSEFDTTHKIPVATVEDLHEDSRGTIWAAMNNYGAIRITPDLEKFKVLKNTAKEAPENYFANTTDGIALNNGQLWFATDGGGINIYDSDKQILSNIRHDPENKNSLPSNSVISLDQNHEGFVWASFWAGGISRINPNTMTFENYSASDHSDGRPWLVNDNTFVVKTDHDGGVWVSVWDYGLQYFDSKNERFYDYSLKADGSGINNKNIVQIEIIDDHVWVAGVYGLENINLKTGETEVVLTGDVYALSSMYFDSTASVYLGSRFGLTRYNLRTKEEKRYTTEHGLPDDSVYYLTQDQHGKLWIATNNGISLFDENTETFKNFYKKDGLVGNNMNTFGRFLHFNNQLYTNSKAGINIINPVDLPSNLQAPKTIISEITIISDKKDDRDFQEHDIKKTDYTELPFRYNSLAFTFTGLSFIFPERNKYKYRLVGWKDTFVEVNASERVARYTNLKPGAYTFEVYSANDSGVWDEQGDHFSFYILPPWYSTWWAITLFLTIGGSTFYGVVQLRLATKIRSEKQLSAKVEAELSAKVNEKTSLLEQNARELKKTSDSLARLNAELEQRVENRTKELQVEVNERKLAESKLFHMAFHDSLTGLPNRQWLIQRIEKAIGRCGQMHDYRFCLMILDGDRFKQINDTYGHITGDQLLISVAARLSNLLSEKQYAARLGGDEFTVFAEDIASVEQMKNLASTIVNAFKAPFSLENNEMYLHMSIGLTICDYQYTSVPSVMRDADIAMYNVKEKEKGSFKIFDKEMRTKILYTAELEADLHKAIENKEFFLVFQPLIRLNTNRIVGFEALLRWQHPKHGLVPPLDFIPLAEETGMIWEVGAFVLDEACRQISLWHSLEIEEKPTVSVNVSTGQFRRSEFLELVDKTIKRHGIDARYLKLEITESVLMEENDTIRKLFDALHSRKIDLAIDDFGTGYSSLAYLNEIPVQHIKIDKKFIDAIDSTASGSVNEDALAIVRATVGLGSSLRKSVTAEGIESRQQLDLLRKCGCDFAQGYYISKPLAPQDAEKLLSVHFENNNENRILNRDDLLTRYKKELDARKPRLRDRS